MSLLEAQRNQLSTYRHTRKPEETPPPGRGSGLFTRGRCHSRLQDVKLGLYHQPRFHFGVMGTRERGRLILSRSVFIRHDHRVGHITPHEADRIAHFGVILGKFRRLIEVFQKVECLYWSIECSPYLVCCPTLVAE